MISVGQFLSLYFYLDDSVLALALALALAFTLFLAMVLVVLGKSTLVRIMNHVIDLSEARDQIVLAIPMILTTVSYYVMMSLAVMFSGRSGGDIELAGATLANAWASVSGFSLMVGLTSALETLCGQAFGARRFRMLGLYLQASCFVTVMFSIIVSILWWYSEYLLILLHQDPEIAKVASVYLKYLIPGLYAYGFIQNIQRFLQTQCIILPLVVSSLSSLPLQICLAKIFSKWTSLVYGGAPLAVSISLWMTFLMLAVYMLKTRRCEQTWEGFKLEYLRFVVANLKVSLPSAAMVCLEYWVFQVLVILAGLMPDSKITTPVIAMCVTTEGIAYMMACGVGTVASTRVSNELGASHPDRAKRAASVAIKLVVMLIPFIDLVLYFGRHLWAGFFTHNPIVIDDFASITPLLLVSVLPDLTQGILSGVARGVGWQRYVVFINLVSLYLIGISVASILGFIYKLHAKGLWIGLSCGLIFQTLCLTLLAKFGRWTKVDDVL